MILDANTPRQQKRLPEREVGGVFGRVPFFPPLNSKESGKL
jgi:hypothetical protein